MKPRLGCRRCGKKVKDCSRPRERALVSATIEEERDGRARPAIERLLGELLAEPERAPLRYREDHGHELLGRKARIIEREMAGAGMAFEQRGEMLVAGPRP